MLSRYDTIERKKAIHTGEFHREKGGIFGLDDEKRLKQINAVLTLDI